MKEFLGDNFFLNNKVAEQLYHDYASPMPIIDYHCHLSPKEIASNRQFKTITEAWLEGDHYKWRAMRTNGVNERFITGEASDREKFLKWGETVPDTVRNPLYHWTHLELRRYFDINEILNPQSAERIYENTTNQLLGSDKTCRGLINQMNVELVCTTDDPTDDLSHHQSVRSDDIGFLMIPAFRPDKVYSTNNSDYEQYIGKLADVSNSKINTFGDLLSALEKRVAYFHDLGCRLSDHGIEQLYDVEISDQEANRIFQSALKGEMIARNDWEVFMMTTLYHLCTLYHKFGWAQQFHLGAIRNNNSRMMGLLGPDTGYDSMGDFSQVRALSKFLDKLDSTDQLTRTILYNLNPNNNEQFATLIGNFNDGSVPGKLQFGSSWWFLDQKLGMEKQMNDLSNMGLLSRFIGMLTDSRSFLSFPRHEYFRRILCNLVGTDVENGELPDDIELLGNLVQNICYNNAKNYFKFPSS